MTYIYIALGLAVWFGCGALAAGLFFAMIQRNFSTHRLDEFKSHVNASRTLLIEGVLGLLRLMVFMVEFAGHEQVSFNGWLWPWSAKARKEAGL